MIYFHRMKISDSIIPFCIIILFLSAFMHFYGFKIWPDAELARTTTAAVLSVMIAAIITGLMLKWQSRTEAERERDVSVYDQKLIVSQEFLNEISAIVEDGKITMQEANKLKFTFSKVAIHFSDENLDKISKNLSEITQHCDVLNTKPVALSTSLMNIIYVIRTELYPHKANKMRNDVSRKNIINHLQIIDNKIEKMHETADSQTYRSKLFKEVAINLDSELQHTSVRITEEGELLLCSKYANWDKAEKLSIKLIFGKNGFSYFQCHTHMEKWNPAERLYPFLQNRFGGSFNNDYWSRQIDGEQGKLLLNGHWNKDEIKHLSQFLANELRTLAIYFNEFILNVREKDILCERYKALTPDWNWQVFDNKGIVLTHLSEAVECSFLCNKKDTITALKLIRKNSSIEWTKTDTPNVDEIVIQESATIPELEKHLASLNDRFITSKKFKMFPSMGQKEQLKKQIATILFKK